MGPYGTTNLRAKPEGMPSHITDPSNVLAAKPPVGAGVTGVSRDDLLQAQNEQLKAELRSIHYELRSTKAANEMLKGDLEQLQTTLSVVASNGTQHRAQHQPWSWFGCAPACDQVNEDPQASSAGPLKSSEIRNPQSEEAFVVRI